VFSSLSTKSSLPLQKMKKPLSQQAIADQCGVSRQTISAWKRAGVDVSESNLEALKKKARQVKVTGEIAREIQEARLRKLQAEADQKEHDLAVQRGEYIRVSDVAEAGAIAAQASKAAWEDLGNSLPPLLDGLTSLQMVPVIRQYSRTKCKELSEVFPAE
jgi:transcriptional regulator with XRE-family HTH domain